MSNGNCNTSISHLLAAATYIDGEIKKPKSGRKSSTLVYKCEIEDVELIFNGQDIKDVVKHKTYSKKNSDKYIKLNKIQENENSSSNGEDGEKLNVGRSPSQRSNHKYLEKHRRANLRNYMDKLKELVPLGPDIQKHTTLGLLRKTQYVIRGLEEKQRKYVTFRDQLKKDQLYLRRRLEQLRHIANGGEIGLGNTILISSTVAAASMKLQSAAKPHILRKSTKAVKDEPICNFIIPDSYSEFQDPTQSFCLLMDEIERMETTVEDDPLSISFDEGMVIPPSMHSLSLIKTEQY